MSSSYTAKPYNRYNVACPSNIIRGYLNHQLTKRHGCTQVPARACNNAMASGDFLHQKSWKIVIYLCQCEVNPNQTKKLQWCIKISYCVFVKLRRYTCQVISQANYLCSMNLVLIFTWDIQHVIVFGYFFLLKSWIFSNLNGVFIG